VALIATPGAANANAYITAIEFAAYLTDRPQVPAVVTSASTAAREAAIIMGTRMIDAKQCFTGAAATATQSLQWPRTGMLSATGYTLADSVIPLQIKDATAEMAIALLVSDIIADNDVAVQGITSIQAGPVSLGFKNDIDVRGLPAIVTSFFASSWLCNPATGPNSSTSFLFEVFNGE